MASLCSSTTRQSQETAHTMERVVPDPHQTLRGQLPNSKSQETLQKIIVHFNQLKPYPSTMRPMAPPGPDKPHCRPATERPAPLGPHLELIFPDSNTEGGNLGPYENPLVVNKQVAAMRTATGNSKQVATALRVKLVRAPHTHKGTLSSPDQHLVIITTRCESEMYS